MAATYPVRTKTYGGSDHSWLASQHGTTTARPITLDLSKFDFATVFTSKMIPSGVVLGKITSGGLYGPYNDALSTGVEVARGILLTDVDVTDFIADAGSTTLTGLKAPGALLITGIVVEANLPTGNGIDAAGKTDLKSFAPAAIQFV
jgi:hypothetical protein